MVYQIIKKIKETDSTKEKQNILEQHKDNSTLKEVYRLTYDNALNYGVRGGITLHDRELEVSMTLREALDILTLKFATREVSGNAAKALLTDMYSSLSVEDRQVLYYVINRDLECGASKTIANKVWPKLIREQPQALCSSYNAKNMENIKFPAYAQLKADGARCFCEVIIDLEGNVETIRMATRAGNEFTAMDHIKSVVESRTKELGLLESYTLDGELTYYINGESTVQSRQFGNGLANSSLQGGITEEQALGFKYEVWDIVPLDEVYNIGTSKDKYKDRYEKLKNWVDGLGEDSPIKLIPTTIVNDEKHALEVYRGYVDQGLEGIILKNKTSKWKNGRLKDQVKFKEVHTADLRVIGYTLHSKDPNKIGSLLLESEDKKVSVSVGSGLKDTWRKRNPETKQWEVIPFSDRPETDRGRILNDWDSVEGSIVEVEYNKLSTSETGTTYSLYLPIFVRFRPDKTEANTLEELIADVGVNNVPTLNSK